MDSTTRASDPTDGQRRPIRDGIGFFGRFLRNPTTVGAVLPSSRYLSRALVGRLELAPGELIVEYGPGTGPATAVVREALPKGANYLGIELECLCEQYWRASQLGEPALLDAEEMRVVLEKFGSYGQQG